MGSGLTVEKAIILDEPVEGEPDWNPPPAEFLHVYNRSNERRVKCRFVEASVWDRLKLERQMRIKMEVVHVDFFQGYGLTENPAPQAPVAEEERQRKLDEETAKKKREMLDTLLFKPTEPDPVQAPAATPAPKAKRRRNAAQDPVLAHAKLPKARKRSGRLSK